MVVGFEGLPNFVADHLRTIAQAEGFADGYAVKHEAGSSVGDGFMATLLSVKLVGDRRKKPSSGVAELDELALICKLKPANAEFVKNFASDAIFSREVHMYKTILPALLNFQAEHGVPAEWAFTALPKCYVATHEVGHNGESVIIMQDLRQAGYAMWPKKTPTQYETVLLLMQQLGRFHGLSLAVRHKNTKLFQEFQRMSSIVDEMLAAPAAPSVFRSCILNAISLFKDPADVRSMEWLGENFNSVFLDSVDGALLGEFGVVSHGDCWNNNMMFVMDEGLAKSIVMFDWQLGRISSPAADLTTYLFSSTVKALRDAHLDEFLRVYYANLAAIVRATGCDPDVVFPEAELHRQLAKFGNIGVMIAPILMPVMVADTADLSNLDDMAETISAGNDAGHIAHLSECTTPEYVQRMQGVLSDARQRGWF